ncbi:MAG: hypothetical protein ACYTGP_12525 [Planctomycetota bacterium]|jgi:hypothetical protein
MMSEVAPETRSPYRHLHIVLSLLIPAAALGFAGSYLEGSTFSGLTFSTLIHVHAALMALWIIMLIAQAWLIRTRKYALHRWVGRSSFVVAPLLLVMTVVATHETLNRKPEITTLDARFEIYDLMQVTGFGLAWALAILYRRRTPLHVRFMVSTVFAMGSAIVFRILLSCFAWVPGLGKGSVEELERTAVVNGAILLLALLGLICMDWRLGIRRSPFWLVTVTTAIIHVGLFTFTKTDWWMSLVQWFAGLA